MRENKLKSLKKTTFSAKEAKEHGLRSYDLKVLISEGLIQKSERGVYQKANFDSFEDEPLLNALAHVGEPSCICLLSAFAYYGLTDEIPDQVWLYVPISKYSHLKSLKIVRKRDPRWNIGIVEENGIKITDINRTVIDALCDKKHVTEPDAFKLAKAALSEKKTTLRGLYAMAKKLGVDERVKLALTLLQDEYV